MKTTTTDTLTTRLSADERETHLYIENNAKVVIMDSTIPRDYNKALRQGWTPIRKTVYPDGTVCGYILEAPLRCLSFRSVKKREYSEEQLNAMRDRMKMIRQSKNA